MMKWLSLFLSMLLIGCTGIPENVQPVKSFEQQRYLGKWYEIARLDHSFERGLTKVTAEYATNADGSIKVINRGFNPETNQWKAAEGKAWFMRTPDEGYLKVTFFWPFYGSYVVFGLDKENYQYALIAGPNHDYLWILSRTPTLDDSTKQSLIQQAQQAGFDTSRLIFVSQN